MDIVALQSEHLEDAARLFAASFRRQRQLVPTLPVRHADVSGVLPMLTDLASRVPGAAALQDGQLCGYLLGLPLDTFKGSERGAYSPIWAHAAAGEDRADVYRRLYEHLSPLWVQGGCLTHAISLYAQDDEASHVWFRNGFGLMVVDAVRPLEAVGARPRLPGLWSAIEQKVTAARSEAVIKRAGADDLDLVLPLAEELDRYMADGPIFLPFIEMQSRSDWTAWLGEPAHALWLALHEGEAIGYMRCQPPKFDVAYVLTDPQTIHVTGAYVRPPWRSQNVAKLLLDHLLSWGRENGYARCSVDFESANIYGSRFWLRHFQPVCHSLVRRLDERIAWANRDRPRESLW